MAALDLSRAFQKPIIHEPWQLAFLKQKIDPFIKEILDIRSRGGSKTLDNMLPTLFYAYCGFDAIHFTAKGDQKGQPKKYLNVLTSHTFLKYRIKSDLKETVIFKNGGTFKLRNLTEATARSSRADIIYFDEEAQADEKAYNAAQMILSVSKLCKVIHGSTPQKGSLFHKNFLRMRDDPTAIIQMRKWDEIGFLNHELILRQKGIVPGWFFRQEFECSFESPAGAVFTNVVYGDFTAIMELQTQKYNRHYITFGLDWNPSAGHYIAGTRWADDYSSLMVLYEENLGTNINIVVDRIIALLKENPHSVLEIEDGGTNSGYCELLFKYLYDHGEKAVAKRVFRRPWDSMGKNKMKSITACLTVPIYCNRALTPEVAKWLELAHWDENSEQPKMEKDGDQHPLDAFLHSEWSGKWL